MNNLKKFAIRLVIVFIGLLIIKNMIQYSFWGFWAEDPDYARSTWHFIHAIFYALMLASGLAVLKDKNV